MSQAARLPLTVVCIVVALAAELGGIALLVAEARAATRALRRWRDAKPEENPDGSYGRQRLMDDEVVEHLLGHEFDRGLAVGLIVLGVVAGALANILILTL